MPETDAELIPLAGLPQILLETGEWTDLLAALGKNASGSVDGAWGSSGSVAVATLSRATNRPILVVLPHVPDLSIWADDISSFSGGRPALFPPHDNWPPTTSRGRITPEAGQRLRILREFRTETPAITLTTISAVLQPVPPLEEVVSSAFSVSIGEVLDPDSLVLWLNNNGYKRCEAVEYAGEYARRGGIIDVFAPDADDPVRLEFFGDELESARLFSAATQRSLKSLSQVTLPSTKTVGPDENNRPVATKYGFVADHMPRDTIIVLVEPAELKEQGSHFHERTANRDGLFTVEGGFASLMELPTVTLSAMPWSSIEATVHLRTESVERFSGNVLKVKDELDAVADQARVVVACQTEAEIHRLTEVFRAGRLAQAGRLSLVPGHVQSGFRLVQADLIVLGSHELFHKEPGPVVAKAAAAGQSRQIESRAIDSFLDLNEGDYVVHVAHGIARFRGMRMLEKKRNDELLPPDWQDEDESPVGLNGMAVEENLILEFRDNFTLYVPASRIDLVQKYVGGQAQGPELSKYGGTAWGRKKQKVAEAVQDMASEMLQIQALRASVPGEALPTDSEWQIEFEAGFPFQETPDQLSAISEIKSDLQRPRPMDRLLCGDVGFGKTEVAVRAAFKAIDNGKQVAVLVPTTILAEQHFRTFSQRFAEYPFIVEVVSRFKSKAKQKEVLEKVGRGEVDVIIGTHRLLSKDVRFKELGLVIVDEEQRFGVEHKERLKALRATVHVLTMTATPIPRTLHGALLGIREISNLETPPPERQPVETRIIRWDDTLIRHAVLREMNRGGQVYFVHNRVYDIKQVATKLETIVPEAKIVIGHGQMGETELETAMLAFVRKEADILVATTIIESGLDIPNANTIFIDDADIYGLADLHQLRGRVGRQKARAYAYLIVQPHKMVTPVAARRLKAIEEFTELGSGFRIAMRDLEIRGAGNILGAEQSGHIAAIGYEMYCQLLENAVRRLNNQPPRQAIEVHIDLPWPAYLPRDYVPGQKLRIEVYRRLSRLRSLKLLDDFRQELVDRYGPLPEPVEWLLRSTEVRLLCVRWELKGVHRDGKDLVLSYRNKKRADRLATRSEGRLRVVDEANIYCRLRPGEDQPEVTYRLLQKVLRPSEDKV